MNRKTILIIDTEGSLCASVQGMFTETGANILVVHDPDDGLSELDAHRPDLILVNLDLPDTSHLDLLPTIRALTPAPIVVVTGIDDGAQWRYLDAGADDVVIKPFHVNILLARIRATMRRSKMQRQQKEGAVYDDGHLLFDPFGYRTTVDGKWVRLTPTEIRLLSYLVNNAGESCTFCQILENVWGDGCKSNREYVHAFIWQLRQKLERDPKSPDYIESVYNVGYRFHAHEYGELERATQV